MLADLGFKHPEAAKLLHVSLRTLQNWLSGRHQVPYAVYKLLRLMRYMELPGQAWHGLHFSRGQLITPEGRTISGHDGAWWSLLVRQSKGFGQLYREQGSLQAELKAARAAALDAKRSAAGATARTLLVPSVAACYADPCSPETPAHRQPEVPSIPHGNHGDHKPITGPYWGHIDTIPESWPLISDFLLPSISSPETTANGSESPSIALSASPLTLICDNLSLPVQWSASMPYRLQVLPLHSFQGLPLNGLSGLSKSSQFSRLRLSAFPAPLWTPGPFLVPSLPRLTAPSSPPGINGTANPVGVPS